MITEYLEMQSVLADRALGVGRLLREFHHHACFGHAVPVASPFIADISPEAVSIAVGMDATKNLYTVQIPVPIFESSNPNALRAWVERENVQYFRSKEDIQAEIDSIQREKELAIMRELMAKYPNESTEYE